MKTRSTFLMSALVLIAIFFLPLASIGQSKDSPATWVAADQGYSNTELVTNFTIDANAIEGLLDKSTGTTAPVYYSSNAGVRMYANNTLSVTPLTGYSLVSIEYVFRKQGNKTYASSTLISDGGTYTPGAAPSNANTDVIDTWVYDGAYKNTVTIRLGSGQRVFRQITVTYLGSAGQTYQVFYHPNMMEGADNPVADPSTYAPGATVTVLSPSALNITNQGYVFTRWSTSVDGQSGIDYLPGNQFVMSDSDVNLYAQWISTTDYRIDELTPTEVNQAIGENTGYQEWNVEGLSGAIYHGKSFKHNNYIQITNSQSGSSQYSGIVTTTSGGTLRRVQVVWNSNTPEGRVLKVYGKNAAYGSTADLYGNTCGTELGTLTKGASSFSELVISDAVNYSYVGLLSLTGAMYLEKITIDWESGSSTDPAIVIEPSPIALGNVVANQPIQTTFVVSQANLNTDITLSPSKGTLSLSSIPQDNAPTSVTWTYTPDGSQNEFPVVITATSGNEEVTLNISATVLPDNSFVTLHESKAAFLLSPSATDVKINLLDVEVVGKTGNYLYLQDGQAGVLVYGAGAPNDFEKGYVFRQGYLLGTYVDYNGIAEVTDFSFVGYEGTTGNTLTTTTATVDQILANPVTYESRYVQITNTTINEWTLPGSNEALAFYDMFHTNYALCTAPANNHVFTVKGMVNRHYSSQNGNGSVSVELAPTALTDILCTNAYAADPSITTGGTANAPVEVTYVDLAPGANATAVYSLWRGATSESMELIVDNQRITSATDVAISGLTRIQIHGERDFYPNSQNTFDYWYDLPANTHSIQFSINGVINQENNVLVTGLLSPTQLPAVETYGDYGLAGWSLSANSTTTIDLGTYTFTGDATLYAVYYKGTSFTYNKVNSLAELTEGEYVITCSSGSSPYTFTNSLSHTSPAAVTLTSLGVTVSGDMLTGSDAVFETISWTFSGPVSEMTITSKAYPQYWLYTANENTGVRVGNTAANTWNITEDNLVTSLFNMKSNRNDRYLALYNNQDWRCYTNLTAPNSYPRMALYKKTPVAPTGNEPKYTRVFWNETAEADIAISGPSLIPSGYYLNMGDWTMNNSTAGNFVIEDGAIFIPASGNDNIKATVKKNITGYGNSDIAGWHLISSPVGSFTPSLVTVDTYVNNMVNDNYDLYGFDQSKAQEWRNNKVNDQLQSFAPLGGLLYASQNDRTIEFVGTLTATVASANPPSLAYTANAALAGWNLIGNPFTSMGYLVANNISDYYRMEDYLNADDVMESHLVLYQIDEPVNPMEGIFVQATSAGQTYYFKNFLRGGAVKQSSVGVTLAGHNGAVVDKARVRINNGVMVGKLMFKENSTKLYIPQGGKEYAVVRSQSQGELPINFVAEADDTYTLTFDLEAVEMGYLHLIDNLTGDDVDLLVTPSYTFEGRYSDYPTRFRIVFSANGSDASEDQESFAYYNGSQWMVSNIGEATLQVVDVLGRIVSASTISGNAEINVDMPGLYVVRLINGNDVKVQKVVVR